jgi:hypothetical protein
LDWAKQEKLLVQDAATAIIGLIVVFVSFYLPDLIGLMVFTVACGVTIMGILNLYFSIHGRKLSFRKDKKAVGWVIGVAICALVFMPFVYWLVGYPFDLLCTAITAQYTFTGVTASAYVLVRAIISYLLAFCLVNVVLWAIITSKAENKYAGY